MQWSEFSSKAADSVWRRSGTWSELLERIASASGYSEKSRCPWVKLATFGDVRSSGNSFRHDLNVTDITGVEGDYDREVMQPEEALRRLEAAHIRCCVYTSPSHTPERPRWRVLAPLSQPAPSKARSALLARINGVLGGVLSGESFTLSQSYYFGKVNGAEYRVLTAFGDPDEGICIDELDELDDSAIGKPANGASAPDVLKQPPGEHTFAEAVQRLGRKLKTGDGRRELLKAFVSSRSARGLRGDDLMLLIDGVQARYFDSADPFTPQDVAGLVRWANGKDDADLAQAEQGRQIVAGVRGAAEQDRTAEAVQPDARAAWSIPEPIGAAELLAARLAPRCIVENYLYADVAALVAPGGTGKTTATLYEAACIALGRRLWGLEVRAAGPVLIVTAEDRREFLVARLREICIALRLTQAEVDQVCAMVRIDDRTADLRRLTAVVEDVVHVDRFAHDLVEGCLAADFRPALVQFDPMVSFGVGESRVNDAEQGLIHAGRVIVAGLDCAVRFVHHTGTAKALDKAAHQYAGRGGSALADGCRMVHVMTSVDAAEFARSTGHMLDDKSESSFALHRPKISYAPPQTEVIYVRRRGYQFEALRALSNEGREDQEAAVRLQREHELRAALLDAADAAHRDGLPLSTRMLIERTHGFKTEAKRGAVAQLIAEGWLVEMRTPPGWRAVNNARRTWLVRLARDELDAFKRDGVLPVEKQTPPPSIARQVEQEVPQ